MVRHTFAASLALISISLAGSFSARAQDAAPAAPAASESKKENAPAPLAVAEAPTDPRSAMPVFKVWQRNSDHGGRFIQVGEGGEVLPIEELPKIIALDHDPEIESQLKKYRRWKLVSNVATGFAVGAGAAAFTLGWMSVADHTDGTGTVLAALAASFVGIAGRVYAENLADQALYGAQAAHNNRILERKPVQAPKTGSLTPQTLRPIAAFTFDFPYLGGGK